MNLHDAQLWRFTESQLAVQLMTSGCQTKESSKATDLAGDMNSRYEFMEKPVLVQKNQVTRLQGHDTASWR